MICIEKKHSHLSLHTHKYLHTHSYPYPLKKYIFYHASNPCISISTYKNISILMHSILTPPQTQSPSLFTTQFTCPPPTPTPPLGNLHLYIDILWPGGGKPTENSWAECTNCGLCCKRHFLFLLRYGRKKQKTEKRSKISARGCWRHVFSVEKLRTNFVSKAIVVFSSATHPGFFRSFYSFIVLFISF